MRSPLPASVIATLLVPSTHLVSTGIHLTGYDRWHIIRALGLPMPEALQRAAEYQEWEKRDA